MTRRRSPTVGVVGLGHVGLATAAAFAYYRVRVVGYDLDPRVRATVARGRAPFYEPGLDSHLRRSTRSGRLAVVGSVRELVELSDVVLLCVPTPRGARGAIDLRPLRSALREIGRSLPGVLTWPTIAIKSTVLPRTAEEFAAPVLAAASGRRARDVSVASNPEFLAEGRMVADALRPARVVLGTRNARDRRALRAIYRPFRAPLAELTPTGAELAKYASNAFLALKVTYANEVSRFSETLGIDVDRVLAVVGKDPRIGSKFLSPGPGYGGSCFAKDLDALLLLGSAVGVHPRILSDLPKANNDQTAHAVKLIDGALRGRRHPVVALLGLSFKEGTDDARESRALPIVRALLRHRVELRLHDPVGWPSFLREWQVRYGGNLPPRARPCASLRTALRGANVAVVQVASSKYRDWPERWTGWMGADPVVVDLRRALGSRARIRLGAGWVGLGVGPHPGRSRQSR